MVSHSFTKENLGRAMVQLPPEADILPVPSETRRPEKTPEIVTRVDYELSVISTKGYSPYFLVVSDLLNYAKSAGIFTNTRGSAAGCRRGIH